MRDHGRDRHRHPTGALKQPLVGVHPASRPVGLGHEFARLPEQRLRQTDDRLRSSERRVGTDELGRDLLQQIAHLGLDLQPFGLDPDVCGEGGQRLERGREPRCDSHQLFVGHAAPGESVRGCVLRVRASTAGTGR